MLNLLALVLLAAQPAALQPTRAALWITGTSNVHDWRCDAAAARLETRFVVRADPAGLLPTAVEVTVPVAALGCGNSTMDQKLRDALKMTAHPNIHFTLASAQPAGDARVLAKGRLSIAGVERAVALLVSLEPGQVLTVRGTLPVQMKDFGLTPPTALLGMLETGDQVVVHFELSFPPPSPAAPRGTR